MSGFVNGQSAAAPTKKKFSMKSLYNSTAGILFAYILLFAFMSVASEYFLSGSNMLSLLKQTVTTGLLAYGLSYCLIIGEIDLSVGSMFSLSGVVVAMLINRGIPFLGAMLIGLGMAAVVGVVNGCLVAYTKIPPFVITLSMMNILRGLSYIISGAIPINCNDKTFVAFASKKLFGIVPNQIIVLLLWGIVLAIVLKYTVFGRHMYATGGNYDAAKYSGINVNRVIIVVYIISATMALFSGTLSASRITQGQPSAGVGYEADAIAAAVLGGISFNGGRGTIPGTFLGALVLSTLTNGLYLLGVNYYLQLVITGLLTIAVVYLDTSKKRVH